MARILTLYGCAWRAAPPALPTEDEFRELFWGRSDSLFNEVRRIHAHLGQPYFEAVNFDGPQQITLADIGLAHLIAADLDRAADDLHKTADALHMVIDELETIHIEVRSVNVPVVDRYGFKRDDV